MSKIKLRHNQSGMASILVTMIMMIVITLIVVGFAQISQRETRNALDSQLTTQAFYAAESGVNDAIKAVKSGHYTTAATAKTTCGPDTYLTNNHVGSSNSYSCLLINPAPGSLKFDLPPSQSTIVPIDVSGSGSPSVTVTWSNQSGTQSFSDCSAFSGGYLPAASITSTCTAGVVRLDLVAGPTPGSPYSSISSLASNTTAAFLVPSNTAGTLTYPALNGANGSTITAKCTTTPTPPAIAGCTASIAGLVPGTQYYLRILPVYAETNLSLTVPSGNTFLGAQVAVDSTGKARDVLRRIVVYVPDYGTTNASDYALQTTQSVCKLITIPQGGGLITLGNPTDPGCQF